MHPTHSFRRSILIDNPSTRRPSRQPDTWFWRGLFMLLGILLGWIMHQHLG
jgi:hypothetical protein